MVAIVGRPNDGALGALHLSAGSNGTRFDKALKVQSTSLFPKRSTRIKASKITKFEWTN